VGRSDQELTTALQLEGQRVILAALKDSDLPAAIKGYLSRFNPGELSNDQITNVFKGAQAVKMLIDEAEPRRRARGSRDRQHQGLFRVARGCEDARWRQRNRLSGRRSTAATRRPCSRPSSS
jgi:hypothetical protein